MFLAQAWAKQATTENRIEVERQLHKAEVDLMVAEIELNEHKRSDHRDAA